MATTRNAARALDGEVMVNVEIGRRIEDLRKKRGFKPATFAHAVLISPQRLYSYETGRCSCSPAILARMAYVLVVSVSELVPEYKPTV